MDQKDFNSEQEIPKQFRNFKEDFSISSPGRINMIGEHTDYNNGFVLPTAIDRTIELHFAANASEFECKIYSKTYNKYFSFDLRKVSRSETAWENYILGVVSELQKQEKQLKGFDCIIESNLPVGAGVSSSAALECGMAFGLNKLFDLGLDRQTMAQLSQSAEHNYVGTKCGIMDQYASILSRKDHLILLDCRSLKASFVPADFKDYKLLLLNTRVSHSLADSEYNSRRAECEQVVEIVQKKYPEVSSLREVNFDILEEVKNEISEVLYKRAHYVLEENDRVLRAVDAIEKGKIDEFGSLMYASHAGLRDEYEVSCKELDFLVDLSKDFDCIAGARMMGGGFGGCTINLIKSDEVDSFIEKAATAYSAEFDIQLQAIPVLPQEGTKVK
ncbi:MAG: galactokinase [Salinimicrobium sp.]